MKSPKENPNSVIISACFEATVEVLKVAVAARPLETDSVEKPDAGPAFQGTMNMHGDWDGEVTVVFSRPLAAELVARLGFCLVTDLDDEFISDGVGELINQIAGRVKTELSKEGWQLAFALPEVSCVSPPAAETSDDTSSNYLFECMGHTFVLKTSARTTACSTAST